MIIPNKPYLWLDSTGRNLIVKMKIWCPSDKQLSSNVPAQETDGDTLRLIYKVIDGSSTDPLTLEFNLRDTSSQYNQDMHTRVTVVITDLAGNILGLGTVKPRFGTFSVSGTGPNIYPYLYIQFANTSQSVVHVAGWVDGAGDMIEVAPPVDNFSTFERKVDYKLKTVTPPQVIIHDDHDLNERNGYDPVLDSIVVSLIEYNSDGTEKRKGIGTVHTSEADASSGD